MLAPAIQPIGVLLVDDHRSVLWGLEKLIASAGPEMEVVGTASRCDEALEAVETHRPDVVLLDVDLGEENGLELLPELRKHSSVKVLILTGIRDPEVRERAVVGGARGLVYKTEPAEVILKAISHVHRGELWLDRATTAKVFISLFGTAKEACGDSPVFTEDALTAAERRIVAAVVAHKGAPCKVIADELHISGHTLRNHLASIYSKLGLHSRLDLVLYAMEHRGDQHIT